MLPKLWVEARRSLDCVCLRCNVPKMQIARMVRAIPVARPAKKKIRIEGKGKRGHSWTGSAVEEGDSEVFGAAVGDGFVVVGMEFVGADVGAVVLVLELEGIGEIS